MTSRIKIPEESMQAVAMPVSTSNIRSIKMDIAAKEEKQNFYTQKHNK